MSKRISLALAIVLVLTLTSGTWMSASAKGPEVPFHAYYPVNATATPDFGCMCLKQVFTPGGYSDVPHLGESLFKGKAVTMMDLSSQVGTGDLVAANGDILTVYYEGSGKVLDSERLFASGIFTFTGGTGRFENVSGGGTYRVIVYLTGDKPNDLWFDGTLIK